MNHLKCQLSPQVRKLREPLLTDVISKTFMYNTHPLAQTPFNLNIPYVRIFIFPNYHPIIIRFKHCAIQTIICFLMELTKVYCNNYSRKPTNFGSDSEILVIFPSRSPKRSSHLGRYKLLLFEHIIFF